MVCVGDGRKKGGWYGEGHQGFGETEAIGREHAWRQPGWLETK